MYGRNGVKNTSDSITASRVDMLIAIYDAAIGAIDKVLKELSGDGENRAVLARSQALVFVGLIESGLDLSQSEVIANRIQQLCQFAEQALLDSNHDNITAARSALNNIRDAFVEIKDEATELESVGAIPPLSLENCIDTVA